MMALMLPEKMLQFVHCLWLSRIKAERYGTGIRGLPDPELLLAIMADE
jgi:hypothetical protein